MVHFESILVYVVMKSNFVILHAGDLGAPAPLIGKTNISLFNCLGILLKNRLIIGGKDYCWTLNYIHCTTCLSFCQPHTILNAVVS